MTKYFIQKEMNTNKIIAFSGFNGTGKNTAASMLNFLVYTNGTGTYDEFVSSSKPSPIPTFMFAYTAKQAASLLSGEDSHLFENNDTKDELLPNSDRTRRELVSWIAEGIKKEFFGAGHLAKLVLNDIRAKGGSGIITDLRNTAEEKEVRRANGIIVSITNNKPTNKDNGNYELSFIKPDYTINNIFNKVYLFREVLFIYKNIFKDV